MDSIEQTTDVLVIGAGMAGLIAATELQQAGRSARVLDKGRGVGGRLASRRIEGATFDHGAPSFTASHPWFATEVVQAGLNGAVTLWTPGSVAGFSDLRNWRGTPSMSAVPKQLSRGLDLQLETTVTDLRVHADRWVATTASGHRFASKSVVLTAPVPQSLALLDAGGIGVSLELRSRLDAIEYERCLTVMAVLEGPSRIPSPGDVILSGGPIASITDNQAKGISNEPAVTLHATPAFSLEHWDHDRLESGRVLLAAAADWLGAGVRTFQVHGWRYSQPKFRDTEPCVLVNQAPPLALAGDAFGGGGVEGAALSGRAAAQAILALETGSHRA
jgi:predicted NAD/FAD-dependent oxidoreductase